MVLSTAMLVGSIISALACAGAGIGQMIYNKNEAQRNRDFQERMSNTSIQRSIADAQKAGISPSLVLGGASQPMGATASAGNGLENAMANSANMLANYIMQDRKLDFLEKMQNEELEHKTQIQQMQMSNSAINQHKFTKKDFDELYTDLDSFKLK